MARTGPELLQETRDLLNEPVAGFWTDAQLYRHLTRAARYYVTRSQRKGNRNVTAASISYAAGAAYDTTTISSGNGVPVRIIRMEDITDNNPGVRLDPSESFDDVRDFQYESVEGSSTRWWVNYTVKDVGGTDQITFEIFLAPVPQTARTLLVRYLIDGGGVSVTAATTALNVQDTVEQCILYRAALSASGQDKDYNRTGNLREELAEYERENDLQMQNLMGEDRVVFTGN